MSLRRCITSLVFALSLLLVGVTVQAEQQMDISATFGQIKVFVNGQRVNKETLLYNGTTYVPLRATAEILKKQVIYDDAMQTAYINSVLTQYPDAKDFIDLIKTETINVYFGRIKLVVDGKTVDKETLLYNGVTYVPLRATAELLNMEVSYEESTKSALIFDKGKATTVATVIGYAEFPTVLDLGVYVKVSLENISKTIENNVTTYRYDRIAISAEQLKSYISELTKSGFVLDNTQTKSGYSVYIKGDISVTIDVTSTNYIVIRLQKININTIINVMYLDFPNIPDIGNFANPKINFDNTTAETNGKTYWYKGLTDITIQLYIDELLKLGYTKDITNSKTGYYVYVKGNVYIIIDTITYKNNGYVVLTIRTITAPTVYLPDYPGIPGLPVGTIGKTTTVDNGKVYWYLDVEDMTIQQYINILIGLGYTNDTANSKAGYYVYVKGDTTIIIDTVSQKSTGYVLITIKVTVKIVYSPDYPTVPLPPVGNPDRTAPTGDGTGKEYWYLDLRDVTIQDYIKILIGMGYTNDTANSKAGYYVYVKGDSTIIIDTISQKNSRYVLIIIKVTVKIVYSPDFPTVPLLPTGKPERTVTTSDERGREYWYLGVKEATVQDYIKLLLEMGYTNDTTNSKAGYYVYVKGDMSVIIDTISNNGYVLITIKKLVPERVEYYTEFPEIPTIGIKYNNSRLTEDRLGYSYWYTVIEEERIEKYVNTLKGLGFTFTKNSASHYTGTKGDITITIDAVSVTIKKAAIKESRMVYYKEFPTVPDFAYVVRNHYVFSQDLITNIPTDSESMKYYRYYTDNTFDNSKSEELLKIYEQTLIEHGFTKDFVSYDLKSYVKDGIKVGFSAYNPIGGGMKEENGSYLFYTESSGWQYDITIRTIGE